MNDNPRPILETICALLCALLIALMIVWAIWITTMAIR